MLSRVDVRRGLRVWPASFLSLVICLGAASGGLHAQERLAAKTGGSPTRIQIFEGPQRALGRTGTCDAAYAKLRYAMEELITQRFENARLSTELAAGKAEAAEIEKASRQQETLLAALMDALAKRDRQIAAIRLETADLLEAAQSEVQRKRAENDHLAAELAAVRKAADAAIVMAQDNLAAISAQIEALDAAAGNAASARAEQPAELLSALGIDVMPGTLWQKPHLESADVEDSSPINAGWWYKP